MPAKRGFRQLIDGTHSKPIVCRGCEQDITFRLDPDGNPLLVNGRPRRYKQTRVYCDPCWERFGKRLNAILTKKAKSKNQRASRR